MKISFYSRSYITKSENRKKKKKLVITLLLLVFHCFVHIPRQ